MDLYCEYTHRQWPEGRFDPDDDWDRQSYGGSYTVDSVHLSGGMRDRVECLEDVVEGDVVHIVYVVYTTGDSFGYEGGQAYMVVATKDPYKAHAAFVWAQTAISSYPTGDWAEGMEHKPFPYWRGYFESVQSIQNDTFEVLA